MVQDGMRHGFTPALPYVRLHIARSSLCIVGCNAKFSWKAFCARTHIGRGQKTIRKKKKERKSGKGRGEKEIKRKIERARERKRGRARVE